MAGRPEEVGRISQLIIQGFAFHCVSLFDDRTPVGIRSVAPGSKASATGEVVECSKFLEWGTSNVVG